MNQKVVSSAILVFACLVSCAVGFDIEDINCYGCRDFDCTRQGALTVKTCSRSNANASCVTIYSDSNANRDHFR